MYASESGNLVQNYFYFKKTGRTKYGFNLLKEKKSKTVVAQVYSSILYCFYWRLFYWAS